MCIRQIWIGVQSALILCDRGIELASFIKKCAVGVEKAGRFRTETDRVFVFGASFVRPAKAFEKVSITGTNFAGGGIKLDRALIIFLRFIHFRLRREDLAQIRVDFYVTGIEPQRRLVFLLCFVEPAVVLECSAIVVMLTRALGQIG